MYKRISLIISLSLLVGCASKQSVPQMPDDSCNRCAARMADQAKDAGSTFTDFIYAVIADGATATLVQLKSFEQYLQEKIEEYKISNPDLVAEGQQQLEIIRIKIRASENRARNYVRESL